MGRGGGYFKYFSCCSVINLQLVSRTRAYPLTEQGKKKSYHKTYIKDFVKKIEFIKLRIKRYTY